MPLHLLKRLLKICTPIIPKKNTNDKAAVTTDIREVKEAEMDVRKVDNDRSEENDVIIPGNLAIRIIRNFLNKALVAGLVMKTAITIMEFTINSSQLTGLLK